MKNPIFSFAACVLVLGLPLSASALTNNDIIKMHKAGLSEETILAAMQKERAEYESSADALIELKGAGVSEKIIQRMISSTSAGMIEPVVSTGSPSAGGASDAATSSARNSVYYQDFPSIAPATIDPVVGKDYFTRFTFHEEGGDYVTTNYARGPVVAINTPVRLVSLSGTTMTLRRLDNHQEVKVKNEEKHTRKSVREFAALMLAAEKTPLEKLPDAVASSVRNGEMRRGMTKELVLMTRGFPPLHETASVDSDRWVYWSSRFVKHTVVFSDGRLSEGRGIL